ncbi:hypothetical protein P3T73_09640 [Kiritimatiellota bacterium B12222]|nr:hypothetical protein P3T73_09640 [Kiritimatiellota bacterium B12222]
MKYFLLACWIIGQSVLGHATEWSFELPPTHYYTEEIHADWRGMDKLSLSVQYIGEAPDTPLLLSLFIQTEEGHWIESRNDLVLSGELQHFTLSLRDDSIDWHLSNGDRVFGKDLLRRVEKWGLRLYSAAPQQGVIRVGKLELDLKQAPVVVDFLPREFPAKVQAGEVVSIAVEPREWRGDLFDPALAPQIEIRSGEEQVWLPTVWVQEYRRRQVPGRKTPDDVPWLRPVFRALWTANVAGKMEVFVHPREGMGAPFFVGEIDISAGAAPVGVQTSTAVDDEWDFWKTLPDVDHVWIWSADSENWGSTEITGVWTPRLDWTDAWGMYAGLGEFMQPRAAAFEQVLTNSSHQGPIRIVTEHVLDNRSQLNWQDHPWNLANGGEMSDPSQLWASSQWQDLIVRRAVYLWNRYGAYEQTTGLYIEVARGSEVHTAWIQALSDRLQRELPGVNIYGVSPGLPQRQVTGALAVGKQGWHKPDQLFGAKEFLKTDAPGGVALVGASEQGFDAAVALMQHWSTREQLQIDVDAQFRKGIFPVMQLHVRTSPDLVFASPLIELHNREVNRVFLDLTDASKWTCFQQPDRKWTPLERMNIREVVLRVFSDQPDETARFEIQQVLTVSAPLVIRGAEKPLVISHLQAPPAEGRALKMMEWIFDLNRFFQNPYDPEEIAVDLKVKLPTGEWVSQPGFFNQEVKRSYINEVETWQLEDRFDWRVRFRPWMEGEHAWRLQVIYQPPEGGKAFRAEKSGTFLATAAEDDRGFLRQSEKDPRYFEFQNGEFFYPLGHTIRSPTDRRPSIYDEGLRKTLQGADDKGTEIYADWFQRLSDNGGNFGRVWISNWWLGLEWNSRHTGYHGRKYFNQLNAARLDRMMQLAEEKGIYLNIETTNHGTFSTSIDREWVENPWSAFSPDEGPVPYASHFLTNEEALKWHAYKMRYLIARIGHSTQVAFWGMLTETEWTEGYFRSMRDINNKNLRPYHPQPYKTDEYREPLKKWTNDTAAYMKQANAHPGVTSTHFSNPKNGLDFWRLPEISVVYNNAYSGFFNMVRPELPSVDPRKVRVPYPELDKRRDVFQQGIVREVYGYADFFRKYAQDDKIVLIGEWGGTPSRNRDSHLIAEFHSGLWASMVTELSGVGGFWWYNLVDYHDLFVHYNAASKFMAGEDLRGKNYKQSRWPVRFKENKGNTLSLRLAVGKANSREAMAYIYSAGLSRSRNSRPAEGMNDDAYPRSGPGWIYVPDVMEDGQYEVEFWNTFTGEMFKKETVFLHPESREIPVPSHRVDVAMKLKFLRKLPPPTPTPVVLPTPIPTPVPTPMPTPQPTAMPPRPPPAAVVSEPAAPHPNIQPPSVSP